MDQLGPGRPLVFGEVLFDLFENGQSVLGGAPFNVAWHLRGFGENPLLISRVGDDEHGERVLSAMRDWGLDTVGIQIDPMHPTGTVQVTLGSGWPVYEIQPAQAYDFIGAEQALKAASGGHYPLLHHGTLVTRSDESRGTLSHLIERLETDIFFDPNLRSPWWEKSAVHDALQIARWAKLNGDEVVAVSEDDLAPGDAELAMDLRKRYELELLVSTLGADGAIAVTRDETIEVPAAIPDGFMDAVGAGDAFDAVLILGLLRGWPLRTVLDRAVSFAASVCRTRGATTMDSALYEKHLEMWARLSEAVP